MAVNQESATKPCLVELPPAPPCQHATQAQPCCPGCARTWAVAAMNRVGQLDRQQRIADREAGQ